MNEYDKEYFEDGINSGKSCYQNYRWMPDLTIPMVRRMFDYLGIFPDDTVLDFGCAKGFMVKAFRHEGVKAYGVDVSSYAINNAPAEIKKYIQLIQPGEIIPLLMDPRRRYDWFIAKDTLEHVEERDLHSQLLCLADVSEKGFAVIPLGDGRKYIIPDYEKDVTHRIRQSTIWWVDAFEKAGFEIEKTGFKVSGIKDRWNSWATGNGFFIVRKR